jgi:DNA-binding MarR family transcriptional regulator
VIVRLTRRGESLFEKTYPTGVRAVTALLDAALTTSEQRTLLRLLEKVSGGDDGGIDAAAGHDGEGAC